MKQLPKEITVCKLECVLMPQGEIICMGKTVGWFKDLGSCLQPASIDTDEQQRDDLLATLQYVLCDAENEIPLYLLSEGGLKAKRAIENAGGSV